MRIETLTHRDAAQGKDIDADLVMFSMCGKGEMDATVLADAVAAWRRLAKVEHIMLHVAGYDDDPRELWQIAEVRDFVRRFCAETQAHQSPALDPTSKALLLACGGDPSIKVTVEPITVEEALARDMAWSKWRRERR